MKKNSLPCAACLWGFLSVLLFTCYPGLSQSYYFENYSAIDGLESKVYAVTQDDDRNVWLGTRTGLARFDGKAFTNFSTENGLAPLGVRILFRDKRNYIWLGHESGGITRYDGKKFEKLPLADSLLKSNITSIVEDHQNQIWITTEAHGALLIKNPAAGLDELHYEHFLKGKKLGDRVFNCLVTSDGSIYFLIGGVDIKKYNPATNDFDSYTPEGIFQYFQFTVMFEDSRKNLWFGTYNGGLYKFNQQTNKFEYFDTKNGLAANWVSTITEDRQNNIWVGHWHMDKSQGGISKISSNGIQVYNMHNGLHDNQIWCIHEDAEGNMLIGTTDHGLDIFKGEQFVSITTSDGLKNNQVWSILQDTKGQIWFGTNEGITVYNNNGDNRVFVHYNQSGNFISNQIRFMKTDRDNNIWIGTSDQGLLKFDSKQKRFLSQFLFNEQLGPEVLAMEIDQNNHLWVGQIDRLVEFDLTKDQFIKTWGQGSDSLPGNKISALFVDSKNTLWVGVGDRKGVGKKINKGFQKIDLKDNVTPTTMAEDLQGNLWIGTESKGIFVYHDSVIRQYSVENGLLSNVISVLVIDNQGNVYAGSNKGLDIINPRNAYVYSYTKRTGFTGIDTKNNAALKDDNGNIWIGTQNGAFLCNTAFFKPAPAEPPIRITEFSVNRISRVMQPNLKLRSNENDIEFRFISINLFNPEAVRYRVLLKGLQDEWRDVMGDENSVLYNKLPPGRYTFSVIAKNSEGKWNSLPAQYKFRILAPPYKRAWFLTMLALMIVSGIVVFIKIRERNLKLEKKVLEDRVKERTLALSVANDQLAMKNKDILDSITYAKRIQLSILPPDIPSDNVFILFKPKDIVSGDFYWLTSAGGKEFLAAVDCTGHGVPGAFMSFIGHTSLNKIVIEQGIYEPAKILNKLNEEVAHTLHQKGEDIVNDGMDIALVAYDTATSTLEYAGAFNPLVLIRKGEIIETKANRFAIGRSTGKENEFTNHSIRIEKGDAIYVFSDGYGDQFGGPDNKKFKTGNLKELFVSFQQKSMDEQRLILDNTIETWRGDNDQIDDILVMGKKFS